MNIERRKNIALTIAEIKKVSESLKLILMNIEIIKVVEEEYRDSEEAIDNLDSAYGTLQKALDNLGDVVSSLKEASK